MLPVSGDGVWRNWTGDQSCSPARFVRPGGTDEVVETVRFAAEAEMAVRVAGAGHSFTDAVLTEDVLLSLDRMDRVLDVERATGLVRVQAGISLKALNLALDVHGLALENLGDIAEQSIAGATATGTHGTGARLRNLSASIHAVQIVTGDGSVVEVTEDADADALRAARLSIGALGVVTEITHRTVPSFTLRGVDEKQPLQRVIERLDELTAENDHFEFYVFPHSQTALTRTNNLTDEPARPPSAAKRWIRDELLVNQAFGLVCRTGRRIPAAIPRLNRFSAWASGKSIRVDKSFRIFATSRGVRFTEMEYAFPRERAVEAFKAIHEVASSGHFDVSFPLEVRFVAPDDALLSPAGGRDTCYIAVHMFQNMAWKPYFRAVEEIAGSFEGRPHWGKRHEQTHTTLAPRYPAWARFQEIRKSFDPGGRFANEYTRRVLGP